MTVEQPFFETNGSKREEIIDHISSMSDDEKGKYSFIWLAEINNGERIVQFDTRGDENSYSNVKDELEKENVTGLYWVPIEAGMTGYGLDTSSVSDNCGLLRRGYIQRTVGEAGSERGFAYRMEADGQYLYVSEDGDALVTQDEALNVVDEFGMTE